MYANNQKSLNTSNYRVLSFRTKNFIFKRCKKCGGKVSPVIYNEFALQDERQYCEKCLAIVSEFTCNFTMDIVVMDLIQRQVLSITAYDEVVCKFMGMTANEYLELLKKDRHLNKKLEDIMLGKHITIDTFAKKTENTKNASKITFTDQGINLIDTLNQYQYQQAPPIRL